jgi:hypothetical protein
MALGKVFRLLLAFSIAGAVQSPQRTELVIRAVDETGAPVRLTRADVYVGSWGGGTVSRLGHEGGAVRIGLDRAAACSLEPALCANHPVFSARLLLAAEGLAPISSDLFEWMKEPASPNDRPPPITIRFPGAAPLSVSAGTRRDVTLKFRRPQARTLRLVDRGGRPVPDARVTVKNFHADTNHMGFFEGDRLLENQRTDARGALTIPDGDVVYGIEVHKPHWEIVRPAPRTWPNQFRQRIDGPLLAVVMRRHAQRPLLLTFQRGGVTVANLDVHACVVPCGGGGCCGRLGTTGKTGDLRVNDFYPEEYDRVYVPAKNDESKSIWEIDPRKPRTGRTIVNLPR